MVSAEMISVLTWTGHDILDRLLLADVKEIKIRIFLLLSRIVVGVRHQDVQVPMPNVDKN